MRTQDRAAADGPLAPTDRSPARRFAGLAPIAALAVGCLLTGFVAGLVLGGFIPAFTSRGIEVAPPAASAETGPNADQRVMPDVRGLSDAQARQVLADMGLGQVPLTVTEAPHLSPANFVVAQSPLAGTPDPTAITLTMPTTAVMPTLAGQPEEAARTALQAMGADVAIERRYVPGQTAGLVLETRPAAKEQVTAGVTLVISAPAQQAYLADVRHEGICSRATTQANGVPFEHALECSAGADARTAVWLLNRRVQQLAGTLGIDDDSDPGTRYAVRITADGKVIHQSTLAYGQTTPLDASVAGVLRLEVSLTRTDGGRNRGTAVLGDVTATGSQADLDTLRTR